MIEVMCDSSGERQTFESEERAYAAGWLKLTTHPSGVERVFWLSPGHVTEAGAILKRAGLLRDGDQIQEIADDTVTVRREGRIRES